MNAIVGKLVWLSLALLTPVKDRTPILPADVEAIGTLENLKYELIDDPDDLLGHGWITARFHIRKVLHGRPHARVITILYLAHTYRKEGLDVHLRLRAKADGTYIVCAEPGGEGLVCH